jgi:hypothetical protein
MFIASLILQNIEPVGGLLEQVSTLVTSSLEVLDNNLSEASFPIHRSSFIGDSTATFIDQSDIDLNTNFFPLEHYNGDQYQMDYYKSSFLKATDSLAYENVVHIPEVDHVLEEIIHYPVANPLQSAYKTFVGTIEYGNTNEEKINEVSHQN